MKKEVRKAEILLDYAPLIDAPPVAPAQLHQKACQNDFTTISAWLDIWLGNIKANHERFGDFKENGVGKLFGKFSHRPVIVAGSGPSLKRNAHILKDRNKDMHVISCLHNFHYFEDLDVDIDFYVTLDSGPIVIDEVSIGGKQSEDWYWERSKDKKLIAYIGSDPKLFEKWQGEVYFFNCPINNESISELSKELEFHTYVGTGGNVLGASTYLAKAIFGGNPIIFIGADFSFANYDVEKPMFHAWDSDYDKEIGYTVGMVDIFGNRCKSWPSYANFKAWFDYVVTVVPGLWINCTEGGTLGAYSEGVLRQCPPMDLKDCLRMYDMFGEMRDQCVDPATKDKKLLF